MDEIENRVTAIVAEHFGMKEAQITRESNFVKDLGADSLDQIELIMEFEEEFDISILDEDAQKIETVGQAIEYIEKHL